MVEGVNNFSAMRIAAAGLSVQRTRMDVMAENIANASTTRTEDGGPYRRKEVRVAALEETGSPSFSETLSKGMTLARSQPGHLSGGRALAPSGEEVGVRVEGIDEDPSEGPLVYDPTHPSADENGYVRMPNVEIITELINLQGAARAYEANLAAMKAAQDAARDTLRIGG